MPSFRVLIAATGLSFAVALALALTLSLPGSGAVQALDEEEPGAQAAGVTPASTVTLTVSNVYDVKATLNISGHATAWYYKADKAPDNTCQGPVTVGTTTKDLTGLAANTSYTYSAYSDNTCATQVGSSVTFATKKQILTLVEKSRYTAALSLRGLNLTKAHVKGDAAPDNTCTKWSGAVDDDGLLQLTELTAGTDYTYRVYEDSGCATELAKIKFTTYGAGLTLSKLGDTTATLKISEHTAAWYYEANKTPDNTCKGPVTAGTATKDLTGLTAGTSYVYRAYSDSSCATQVGRVGFYTMETGATHELTVSHVSPTTVQLTVSGTGGNPWYFSADDYESGRCISGREDYDNYIAYLTGLTPGATYTFTAYKYVNPSVVPACTLEMATASPFTTPAQMTECDSLSIVAAGVTRNASSERWSRYVQVKNNTDQAIHDVRALTYYSVGNISTAQADPIFRRQHGAGTISELQPRATGQITYTSPSYFDTPLLEMNGVVQLVNPATSAVLCETAIEPSWWRKAESVVLKGVTNPEYGVSTQLDNPLPGAGEYATFSITAYATTRDQLLQVCVNLDFDGLEPVDADEDGHHDVVIYDGPNGKYQEDGTLNSDGFRRAGRLEYDSDGYNEDVASNRHRPQCSDADGKFEGGLFRIGNTERRRNSAVKWPTPLTETRTWPLTYTVKVPVTVTASGSGCLTATVRALPPETTDNLATAYEKSQDNTAKACLGAPPAQDPLDPPDPERPVLFQEGRADLMTLHKCADGTSFPCDGKSAGDLVQYVRMASDVFDGSHLAYIDSGLAAANAGSPYSAFRPGDVVTHVRDLDTAGGRRARKNVQTGYPAGPAWHTGNDRPDDPNDGNDFGPLNLKGVSVKTRWLGADYNRYYFSICPKHNADYLTDLTNTTPCDSNATDTNPGPIRGIYWKSWTLNVFDIAETPQPTFDVNWSSLQALGLVFEFSTLGTHEADIIIEGRPTAGTRRTLGRHKFHVGPAADLSVHEGGASASVASGKRAFTIVAESEATAEIAAESSGGHGHGEPEKINLESLRPTVTVTSNNAVIPAANVSQVGATAGAYDTTTGVWALPDGFQGRATLTLVADASAVNSVKAAITNSAEVCENDAGAAQATVDGRAAVDRATCEFKKDGTTSNHHWGAYQRCIKADASAVGDDPHHPHHISDKNTCTTIANPNRTWHTTEWYDWRPQNNEVTFTPDAAGFTLTARGVDGTSIDLLWAKQAGADDYAIYSISTADLTSTDNLGLLLTVNQIAVVPADTTAYYHDGLKRGQKRQYLIRARQDGRPFAMSNLAGATAQIPGRAVQGPPASRAPGSVVSLTAARKSDDATTIEVKWNAPSTGATGYNVQYRSRLGSSGSYGDWTGLSTQQGGTTFTFHNAGGGTSYQFQVRAVNVFGGQTNYSGWSTSNTVSPVSNPNQVSNLEATRDSAGTTIEVSWTAPSSGTTPTGYQVQYQSRTGNSGAWDAWQPDPVTTQTGTTYALTGAPGPRATSSACAR